MPPKRCRPRQTNSRQPIAQPIRIAFGRNIISRNHVASRRPCRLPVPILRRLDRLVAWLRDGRGGRAWHTRLARIGTDPDGACQISPISYRMPVPAGHRGSGYPILIWRHGKWAGCGMRVEASIGCDIEHAGISRSPPKFHPMRFRLVHRWSYHILGMSMDFPRVLESRSGYRPWRLGASPLIAGRRGGRGENRMSLEDTWHVAR